MLQRRSGALQRSMHVLYSGHITAVALPWSMHIMVSIAVGYKGKGIRFIVCIHRSGYVAVCYLCRNLTCAHSLRRSILMLIIWYCHDFGKSKGFAIHAAMCLSGYHESLLISLWFRHTFSYSTPGTPDILLDGEPTHTPFLPTDHSLLEKKEHILI